ncbi:uncharacterized protein LOC121444587 isoform X1 [Microtus oregoni]|uniref:uncharacterized protein LOC121444056 isoform X1 n=1 Tax=Microtus oregoni TaxID=111838 RepID=UPI001BB1B1CB|nr:uncharacterized protein LOC121444056 isoform X1 [Microtus oregoni]XP_041502355.1 uncharacterized protein LOC121444587 isoform X1 [Microtus oregoni]
MTASPQSTAGLISSTWEEAEGWQCSSCKLQPCSTQSWYLGDLLGMALTPRPSSRSCQWGRAAAHGGVLEDLREAAVRGVQQAQAEDLDIVDVDQLEKVLPQLLLDF